MRKIARLRDALAEINDALRDRSPEDGPSGDDQALSDTVRILWGGEDQGDLTPDVPLRLERGEESSLEGELEPIFQLPPAIEDGVPKLGSDQETLIAQDVLMYGVDALGWYCSFHVRGWQWGVYVKVSGLLYLAQNAFAELDVEPVTKIRLAFRAILDHELFHFATDYAIGQTELAVYDAWWVPFKRSGHDRKQEEKLANAYMLRRFRSGPKVQGKQEALRSFTTQQPAGYKDAHKVGPNDWSNELAKLASEYGAIWAVECYSEGTVFGDAYDWEAQFPIRPAVDWRYCPIHLVDDSQRFDLPEGWLESFSCLQRIVESAAFKKQLSQLPPALQKAWGRAKEKLRTAITSGCDFKQWPRGGADTWSCRVGDNFRVHLRHDRAGGFWEAVAIGSHKAMGHG